MNIFSSMYTISNCGASLLQESVTELPNGMIKIRYLQSQFALAQSGSQLSYTHNGATYTSERNQYVVENNVQYQDVYFRSKIIPPYPLC